MKVKLLLLLSVEFLNLALCIGQSSVPYKKTQSLSYKDLNFNEVFATLTDTNDNIWMLNGNNICRNTGYDIDCFPLPIVQARSMFFIGKSIIVIVNDSQNAFCYFDLETYQCKIITVPDAALICQNFSFDENLYFIHKDNLLKYDFTKNTYTKEKKVAQIPFNQLARCYKTRNGSIVRLYVDKLVIDDKIFPIDKIDATRFIDLVELKDGYIINNGHDIYLYNINKASFNKIYTDHFDCKKIWTDKVGNLLMAIPQQNQCNLISKLYLLKPEISITKKIVFQEDLSYLIDQKDFQTTIINCNANDFGKRINFATHMGMYSCEKTENAYATTLMINNKTARFGHVIKGITKDKSGNVYYGGEENNIYVQKPNNTIDTIPINVMLNGSIRRLTNGRNLLYDSTKNWIYGASGHYKKDISTLYALDIKSRTLVKYWPINNRIFFILEHDSKIYMATSGNYILTLDMNTMLIDTLISFKSENVQTRVFYVEENNLLIGTDNGLLTYNLSSNKLTLKKELENVPIVGISENKQNLYITSNLSGLYIIDKISRKVTHYDKTVGMSNNSVNIAAVLNNGNIIVSLENGLNLINVKEKLVLHLTSDNISISDNEFNTQAYFIDNDKIYLGTVNGATIIDKKKLEKSNNYVVYVSKFEVTDFGKQVYTNYHNVINLIFSPMTQKMLIHFGSSNNSNKISFAYKFNNLGRWTVLEGNKLELIRPLVDALTMEVKCTDLNGVWSDKSTVYNIEVQHHFYNKLWFYILLTTLISSLIYLFAKWRIRELKSHHDEIVSINKRISELNLVALQSQMNPHFLFNAMTSIQYYLKTNDMVKAEEVLSSFGKLIRMILESSKVKTWTLEEEILLLQNYIEIEKEKFEKDEIQINFDVSNLKNSKWLIPPMLIQPFIENAFKHAFVMMEKQAILNICISDKMDTIQISIMDNGIGIDTLLKQKVKTGPSSLGMKIIAERIQLYNENSKIGKITFLINPIGKKPKNGTLIELKFPKTLI